MTVATGMVTTIAGTGTASYSGDNGAATSASLYNPHGVALDSTGIHALTSLIPTYIATFIGNVYIADTHNHRIRKIAISTGIITTIAGTGTGSYSGDGGAATSATLNDPCGVALDASGKL